MRSIIIPVEGECTFTDEDPSVVARKLLETDMLSVVTCRALELPRMYVLFIDDWGAVDFNGRPPLPINRRAWALYGGSPIHGLAIFCRDDHQDMTQGALDALNDPAYPSPSVLQAMDSFMEAYPDA